MVKRQYYNLNGNKPGRFNMIGYNSSESNTTCSHGYVGVMYLAKLQILNLVWSHSHNSARALSTLSEESARAELWEGDQTNFGLSPPPEMEAMIRLNLPAIRPGPAFDHTLRKNISLKLDSKYHLEFYLTQCFDDLHI